jgi:hypothetical protein
VTRLVQLTVAGDVAEAEQVQELLAAAGIDAAHIADEARQLVGAPA